MSRMILKIVEYPKETFIDEEELTDEGRHILIQEARDLIERLEEMGA